MSRTTLAELKHQLQREKPTLALRYGVAQIGIFGSYIRNEQRPDSDLDLLVEFDPTAAIDLLTLTNLQNYLTDRLGLPVDIALKSSLRKRIGQRILAEVEML